MYNSLGLCDISNQSRKTLLQNPNLTQSKTKEHKRSANSVGNKNQIHTRMNAVRQ